MAEELQGLLEKIHQDAVQKATGEKEQILAKARQEAEKLIKEAKVSADAIRKTAEEDANRSEERAKAAIRQAARDITISLRSELEKRLTSLVQNGIGEAMTPEFMGKILLEMVRNYTAGSGGNVGIEVLINQKDLEKMQALFTGSLVQDLKIKPEISVGHDFGSGLKIGFKGNDVFLDFSDEAISDLICAFVGPRLTAILESGKE